MPSDVPITSFEDMRIETCTNVAAVTLLVYDYLLTFGSEVNLIWPSQFSFVKILFMLTRYLPCVDVTLVLLYSLKVNISAETCVRLYKPAGWLVALGIIIAEVILVVRTWAIWGGGRRLAIILGLVSVVAIVPVAFIENMFLTSVRFFTYPGYATAGCLLSAGNTIIAANFVIVILFETFVLILTLIKGVQHFRSARDDNLIAILYRDGVLFYIYLLCFSVISLIVIIAAPRVLADMLSVVQRVSHSCLSARVLLNLREARRREDEVSRRINSTPLRFLTQLTGNSAGVTTSHDDNALLPQPIGTLASGRLRDDHGGVIDIS